MLNFFELDKKENKNYVKLMKIVAKLSRLYSDSDTPYIYIIELWKIYFAIVLELKI